MKRGYYIPILSYHAVSPDEQYYHTAEEFEQQISWLGENGYSGISLDMYWRYVSGQLSDGELPEKPVLIVFDDGRDSNYTYAFPILRMYNMHFTLFIIGSVVGNRDFMTWEQIREMVNSGLCSLGSHSSNMHYFELEYSNAQAWGALAIKIWKDSGVYAYLNQGQFYPMESYFALPIAGTAKDYDTGGLYPIESYLGFYADKSIGIDRIILKCPTHIPSETYYDLNVRVSIGRKGSPNTIDDETIVNPSWRPKREAIDLVNEIFGTTWVNGRYDVIFFDRSYSVVQGNWYNIHLQTLNTDSSQKEFRIYMDPSLPFNLKNCATNSQSSDYNVINGWAIHHGLPMIILSNGTGGSETYEEYHLRVSEDTIKIKRQIEERAGNCISSTYHTPRRIPNSSWETVIPLFGASYTTVASYDNVTGEFTGYDIGPFEALESYFKIVFDAGFSCTRVKVMPGRSYKRQYAALCDVYIGYWNNGNPNSFTRVKKGFTAAYRWDSYTGGMEIDFDEDAAYSFNPGIQYCILFKTLNYDYVASEDPSEGVFRILGDWIEGGPEITAYWNSRAGDGEGDRFVRACVNPNIMFYSESSSYPAGKYTPPVWSIAFPFGAYNDELNQIQTEHGMKMQFTIFSGIFDNRPHRNEAAVDDLQEIPRIMMVKNMPPFSEVVRMHTFEKYLPKQLVPQVKKYAWVINREWGTHSLRTHWDQIDVAIFDAYNFDSVLNIVGEPNSDWMWFKTEKRKKVYASFGNFREDRFDPNIASAVLDNPEISVNSIIQILQAGNWDGCAIDFEEVNPGDRAKAVLWFNYLSQKLHSQTKYYDIVVASPYPYSRNPSWEEWFDYIQIGAVVDKIIPMTYLDHGPWTEPGPVSDFLLFRQRYRRLLQLVPAHKLVGGLGVFGCQWIENEGAEKNLIELTALMEGVSAPQKDAVADEWYGYITQGTVWFQAPDTFYNRIKWLYDQGILSVSIWKLDDDDDNWWNNDCTRAINMWDLIVWTGNLALVKQNLEALGYGGLRNSSNQFDEEWTEALNYALWEFTNDYGLTKQYLDSGYDKPMLYGWIQDAAKGIIDPIGAIIPQVPTTLPDGTPITVSNKENEITYEYFMRYVYRKDSNYSSEIPYAAYMAWLADIYGMTSIEGFWDIGGKAAIGFFEGLWDSVRDTVGGIWNVITHWDETIEGVKFLLRAVTDWKSEEAQLLWTMIKQGIADVYNDFSSGDSEVIGRRVGKLVGDIVLGIITAKGVDKAVKAIRASAEAGALATLMGELKSGLKNVDNVIVVLDSTAEAVEFMGNIAVRYADDVMKYVYKAGIYKPIEVTVNNWEELEEIAINMYTSFRTRTDDVLEVAQNTGWDIKDIEKIKRHMFLDELRLDDGIRLLDPDYEMAVAWERLVNGEFYQSDILLLKHELYESTYYRTFDAMQRAAHDETNKIFNWQSLIESLR